MYWFTGLLGIALGVAPWILNYSGNNAAMWTSVILGGLIVLASAYKGFVQGTETWEYAFVGLAGLAAVIAPFVFDFTAITWALWAFIAVGVVALLVASYEVFFVAPEAA
jgi:hypothetical protein